MIYHLTIAETEDKPFRPHEIWQAALARFQYKANAKVEKVAAATTTTDAAAPAAPASADQKAEEAKPEAGTTP